MKKACFFAIMLLLIIGVIEAMAQLSYWVIHKHRYALSNFQGIVTDEKSESMEQVAGFLQQEVIHPYVGYVFDFRNEERNQSTYGFDTKTPPLIKREPGKVNIVILGGSVADALSKIIGPHLQKALKDSPRIINLAMGGGKEPQQLFALAYFLSLGAEYDLVINVDGFNEIALPYLENYTAGINPFFPRSWKMRFTRKYDMEEISLVGKIKYLRELKQTALNNLAKSYFNKSAVYGLIKAQELQRLNNQIYKTTIDLYVSQRRVANRFEESGPFSKYDNPVDLYRDCAAVWVRTSLQLDALCKLYGIEYYHFLQPNQYVPDSKNFTAEEKKIAFTESQPYRDAVLKGYPFLKGQSGLLLKNKVKYFDATMIFAEVPETVYGDNCCHYNKKGNNIFADYIVQKIKEATRFKIN